jgi:hypothetical protein
MSMIPLGGSEAFANGPRNKARRISANAKTTAITVNPKDIFTQPIAGLALAQCRISALWETVEY